MVVYEPRGGECKKTSVSMVACKNGGIICAYLVWSIIDAVAGGRIFDVTNPPIREIIAEAGKNVTLECPGVTEQSLVSMLEWRANGVLIVEYSSSSTTVSNHRDRVSFFPKNFTLLFHPVTSADSGDYQCVVNNRKTPEAVLRIIVQAFDYNHVKEWKKQFPECAGKRESPVDIQSKLINGKIENPLKFKNCGVKPTEMTLTNNGHTVVLMSKWPAGQTPSLSGGPLNNSTYVFDSLHFHWGPTNNKGSEHTFEGRHFPLEMHLVTYKKDYGSVKDAISKPDGLAVIGVLFGLRKKGDSKLDKIMKGLPKVTESNKKTAIELFALSKFQLDKVPLFVTYPGSLTTPPCSQSVTWIISNREIAVTEKQMQAFREIKLGHQEKENDRPSQPLNQRSFKLVKATRA